MEHARTFRSAGAITEAPFDRVALPHHLRHLRRKLLELSNGEMIMLDLPKAVQLRHGDRLVLDSGATVEVQASLEPLYEIRARDALHLTELAWHLGNRHLSAEISGDRILIPRDHVIRAMLEGLGALVVEIVAPFQPLHGAYAGHAHGGHDHDG